MLFKLKILTAKKKRRGFVCRENAVGRPRFVGPRKRGAGNQINTRRKENV
jgi:hypothetical protein